MVFYYYFFFTFHSDVIIPCPVSGLIEISTVERGVVSLYGVKSELFVAMNSRGRLYGTVGRLCTVFHLLSSNVTSWESENRTHLQLDPPF